MFKYDQDVLRQENKTLSDKLTQGVIGNDSKERFRLLASQMNTMIHKLDLILSLNDQAKKNDIFKEKLHQ